MATQNFWQWKGDGVTGAGLVQFTGAATVDIGQVTTSSGATYYTADPLTGALITIDTDHHQIHEGDYFTFSTKITITPSGTYNFVFQTPASSSATIHYRPANIVSSADKLDILFYEGCSTSGGTVATAQNRNRISTAVSTFVVAYNVTVTSSGTLFNTSYIPGATGIGGSRSGGEIGAINEWILKHSTNYCGRLINGSTTDNTVLVIITWYEE
jgi:hypothetical protein